MVKVKSVALEGWEIKDPLWWCQYYKTSVSTLCVRIEEYLKAESEEEKAVIASLLNVLLDNFHDKGIGIVVPYEDEEDDKEDK
jgi:hypothetical protein